LTTLIERSRPVTIHSQIITRQSSSFREAESWKDDRLETFEEIIKEGRKFGVFVTISSQRPNDISPTITSWGSQLLHPQAAQRGRPKGHRERRIL
jgi:hypothetical protein